MRYADPDGRDIKGMVRGTLKIILATLEMKSGMGMLLGAVAGEFLTVGLSTGCFSCTRYRRYCNNGRWC